MLIKAASIKKGCYAYQCFDNADMHMYEILIEIYLAVQELWAFSLTGNRGTDNWTDLHSDYSAHLRVVQSFNLFARSLSYTRKLLEQNNGFLRCYVPLLS